jgi:hypothetical protein
MSRSNQNDVPCRGENPGSVADWSDVAALQRRLIEAAETINLLAGDVGTAKHVIDYDGDRRKRALARAMQPALMGGDSAAKAEAEGRASETYAKELIQLGKEHQAALMVIAEFDAKRLEWETARSLLSMMKETIKQL